MQICQAILLGVLQGLTEWIPISSEGQTILAMIGWLGISPEAAISYSIFLHLGTMAVVIVKFRDEFAGIFKAPNSILSRTVIISTIFTGLTGVPIYLLIKETFSGGRDAMAAIGVLLLLTGLLMRSGSSGQRSLDEISTKEMAILGLVQGLAILPGISRSGITMALLLMRNFRQKDALVISFIISVPAVLGAVVIDGIYPALTGNDAYAIFPGPGAGMAMLLASFLVGYASMNSLLRFSKAVSFSWFCVAMGLITLLAVVAF